MIWDFRTANDLLGESEASYEEIFVGDLLEIYPKQMSLLRALLLVIWSATLHTALIELLER